MNEYKIKIENLFKIVRALTLRVEELDKNKIGNENDIINNQGVEDHRDILFDGEA